MAIVKGDVQRYRHSLASTWCCNWLLYQGPTPLKGMSARQSVAAEMGLLDTMTASNAWTTSPHTCAEKVRAIYAWMEVPMRPALYQMLWLPGDRPLPPARAPSSSSMPMLVLLGATPDNSVFRTHLVCKICKANFSVQDDDHDKDNIAKKQLCSECFAADQLSTALNNAGASEL